MVLKEVKHLAFVYRNRLNCELQGEDRTVAYTVSAMNVLKANIKHFLCECREKRMLHFPSGSLEAVLRRAPLIEKSFQQVKFFLINLTDAVAYM